MHGSMNVKLKKKNSYPLLHVVQDHMLVCKMYWCYMLVSPNLFGVNLNTKAKPKKLTVLRYS